VFSQEVRTLRHNIQRLFSVDVHVQEQKTYPEVSPVYQKLVEINNNNTTDALKQLCHLTELFEIVIGTSYISMNNGALYKRMIPAFI
jgi:hypothetical protein